jgi:MFS family permease
MRYFQREKLSSYVLFIALVLIWIPGTSVYMVLPLYFNDLGLSTANIGILMALGTLPGAFSALLGGWLSDRIGRKPVLLFGFFIYSSCFFLYFIPNFRFLALARFIAGASFYTTPSVATALIIDSFPSEKRGQAAGLYQSAVGIGGFTGPLIAGAILTATNYNIYFISCVITVLTGSILTLLFVKESLTKKTNLSKPKWKPNLKLNNFKESLKKIGKPLSLFYTSMFIRALGQSGIGALFSVFLQDRIIGMGITEISLLYSIPRPILTIISPLAGKLSDKIGRKKPLIVTILIASAIQLLYIRCNTFLSILIVRIAETVTRAFSGPTTTAYYVDLLTMSGQSGRLGAGLGAYNFLMHETSSLGTIYSGYIVDIFGFNQLFEIAAAMSFTSSLFLIGIPNINTEKALTSK